MKQSYREYLEESTNTVKSKERNGKLLLILTTLAIWAVSLLCVGLVYAGADASGYSLIVIWMVLPVTFLITSIMVGKNNYFGRYMCTYPLGISIIYTLSSIATSAVSQNTISGSSVFWPSFMKLPIGLLVSFAGLGIGLLIRNKEMRTTKQK